MVKKFIEVEGIDCYQIAFNLSNLVWGIVIKWDYFARDTVGKQLVRSTDGISANIAEGYGRYNKKDKIRFYRYAYGSLKETIDWLKKAHTRNLIKNGDYNHFINEVDKLPKLINQLIKYTNDKLQF